MGGVSAADAKRDLTIEMVLLGGRTNTLTEFGKLGYAAGLLVWGAESQPSGNINLVCRPV
jgi:hypothetical protein